MTEMQKSATVPGLITAQPSAVRYGRGVLALIALLLIAFVISTGLITINQRGAVAPVTDGAAVTDGWLPAVTAANEARALAAARETVDGWSVRLLTGTSGGEVTDGWASRYLVDGN